ncbi:MAG: Gfo/Idh/MocA family protein [Armatimonadota bacterium]
MNMNRKVRVGVFGGRRGQSMINVLARHPDAELVAICEGYGPQLDACKALAEQIGRSVECYQDFDRFFEHDMDAVVLANFATEHAPYAVRLLDSGRHVCSELMVCQTMAEGVALVEAVERNPECVYTYAENCSYFPTVVEMKKIYERGDIGEFMLGEGQYIHDCESYWAALTQGKRDHWRNWTPSTFYVTHSTGPLMTVTGTRPVRVNAYETPNVNKRKVGSSSADAAMVICQMDNGAVASFIPWASLKREPGMQWFTVYGSKGMMETDRWDDTSAMLNIYIDGKERIRYKPELPGWMTDLSINAEHGGADFFTMHYFLESILDRSGKEHAIDVYQGLDMTLPGMLGYRSIWERNIPIDVPDFRDKSIREQYRNDNWCADPKMAGSGQPSSCSSGLIDVPDSVYKTLTDQL